MNDTVRSEAGLVRILVVGSGGVGDAVERACCIYATAPLLEPADLRRGLELLRGSDADYVFTCTPFEAAPQRALIRDGAGRVRMLHPEHELTRSQDLPETFHDAGQFYWGSARAWLESRRARPLYA